MGAGQSTLGAEQGVARDVGVDRAHPGHGLLRVRGNLATVEVHGQYRMTQGSDSVPEVADEIVETPHSWIKSTPGRGWVAPAGRLR